jgi:hypothetical protein
VNCEPLAIQAGFGEQVVDDGGHALEGTSEVGGLVLLIGFTLGRPVVGVSNPCFDL